MLLFVSLDGEMRQDGWNGAAHESNTRAAVLHIIIIKHIFMCVNPETVLNLKIINKRGENNVCVLIILFELSSLCHDWKVTQLASSSEVHWLKDYQQFGKL